MSRAITLPAADRDKVQALVRAGERLYGLYHEDVVDHACRAPQYLIPDEMSWLRCPCGVRVDRDGDELTGQFIRNALRKGRPMSYRLAVDLLKLVNGARKTTAWRKAWRSAHPRERDAWDLRYSRLWTRLAREGGLVRLR